MSRRHQEPVKPPGLTLSDGLYAAWRHKGKIVLISLSGLAAALLLPVLRPVPFQSEAKLYIRYVRESKTPTQGGGGEDWIKSPDERGASIINTELELLTSLDLAQQVADVVGPAKVLARCGGGTNRQGAAKVIQSGLSAEVARNSSVIRIVFQHPEAGLVQPVLKQIVDLYFRKHTEIHAVGAFDKFLAQETDQLRSRLTQTEEQLRKASAKARVISLEDSKRTYVEQIARIRQAILDAEAELAERRANAEELGKLLHTQPTASTNAAEASRPVAPSPAQAANHRQVCGTLEILRRQQQELLSHYTEESPIVQGVQARIRAYEERQRQLETEAPGLLLHRSPEGQTGTAEASPTPRTNWATEIARVAALESKIKVLREQLETTRSEADSIVEAGISIAELKRKQSLEEADYEAFQRSLNQAHLDERLGAGKVSNISTIQEPSPPFRAASKLRKQMALIAVGSLASAFGLAFLIEFYLDRSIKRPSELEAKLGLPLFLTIPFVKQHGRGRGLMLGRGRRLLPEGASWTGEANAGQNSHEAAVAVQRVDSAGKPEPTPPWIPQPALRAHHAALRDQLIAWFESKGLTHKPKMVAVTSCGEGSGVSTVASGLAALFSETGEGNVLLVDMNSEHETAHDFYQGKLCGLDQALEAGQRNEARVQENLYVVTESGQQEGPSGGWPKRFTRLVPRLKASDYDYIIFDMPPVSRISATSRLARFMDMVLLVVEAEQTDRELVQQASAFLQQSRAELGVVLNKGRTYVPRKLLQEL